MGESNFRSDCEIDERVDLVIHRPAISNALTQSNGSHGIHGGIGMYTYIRC